MISTTTKITLRIILLFTVIMFCSFIPDNFHEFFGDWHCNGSGDVIYQNGSIFGRYEFCNYGDLNYHEATWHWGYRHWLLFAMGIVIFIVQIIDIINTSSKK